jgi:hypothetical protein
MENNEKTFALLAKVKTIQIVEIGTILPKWWDGLVWEMFADKAPFTWGDNNRSLISVERFVAHLRNSLTTYPKKEVLETFVKELENLPSGTYIDLEN